MEIGASSREERPIKAIWKQARRLIVIVVGATVVLFGTALLVLPGPGIVFIAAGLAIFATEFVWARRLLRRVREQGSELAGQIRGKRTSDKPPETDHSD